MSGYDTAAYNEGWEDGKRAAEEEFAKFAPLSRRDQFAMAAMQGAIACGGLYHEGNRMSAAHECVGIADALIAALDGGA